MKNKECKNCNKIYVAKYNAEKYCMDCKFILKENKKQSDKQYKLKNKEKLRLQNKNYRDRNRIIIRKRERDYYINNREKRILCTKNTPNRKIVRMKSQNKRRQDPIFKLHQNISLSINKKLKSINVSKNGASIINYLPYTIQELKSHLESQFESWMNWSNWGKYNSKTWNDNDPSTWTWQIDHIIPKSKFIYLNFQDDNFKKCWGLNNLRPYSAKRNIIEQNRRGL